MKYVAAVALMTVQATAQPYQYPAKGSAEQRANYERGQTAQFEFEQRLFSDAGFQPLDEVVAGKRAVKRALFEDPYMMLPVPGVEIERKANGSVTLQIIGRAEKDAAVVLPASAWSRLTSLEGSLFRPKPYVPWNPLSADTPPPSPPPTCHGWIIRFGSANKAGLRSGSWAQCGGTARPELAYAVEIAKLAVSTRPGCKYDEADPFWAFKACFSHPLRQ